MCFASCDVKERSDESGGLHPLAQLTAEGAWRRVDQTLPTQLALSKALQGQTIILTHSFFPFPSSYSYSSSSFLSSFKSFLLSPYYDHFNFLTFSFYLLTFSHVSQNTGRQRMQS